MYDKAKDKGVISEKDYELIQIYVDRLQNNSVPTIFNLRHLRKILQIPKRQQENYFSSQRGGLYHRFKIPKKSDGYRIIEAPNDELKYKQLWIKNNIIDKFKISDAAKGFKKHYSIYDNALMHVNKELVINIDIKDFFPSIKYNQVFRFFNYIGYNIQVSHLLAKLCTNNRNALPQGAPSSPSLSNIILLKLDKRLARLALSAECSYSRYADDITFSGKKNIRSLVPIIIKIINDEGFEVNQSKLRLQYANQRQEVTGLIVNKKVSLDKRIIKKLENAIYYCSKYGVGDHMAKIQSDKSYYKEHLYGLAYFVKMIEPEKGKDYLAQLNKIEWLY